MNQPSLFDGQRLQMTDSIRLTIESLDAHAEHRHWTIAWSGGKDSTALLTFIIWAALAGKVRRPKRITVLYADTRMEIPPLWYAAQTIREELEVAAEELAAVGVELRVEVVMAPIDHRFWVYMLGRGVPPPSNTFRWCTDKLKVMPMAAAVERLAADGGAKLLLLTGLRKGESAARDQRIALACSRDDGECGQGWFQLSMPDAACDRLAPMLHWRVCHVWEWLRRWAPLVEFGDWTTEPIAEAYGGDEAEEDGARTGCIDCNLVVEDRTFARCARMPGWAHLGLLAGRLKELYAEMKEPRHRLRKPPGERRKDGTLSLNQQRMGPLKLASRIHFLNRVLAIQKEVNVAARAAGNRTVTLIDAEEEARIRECIAAGMWPEKWTGDEPGAEEMTDRHFADGTVQPLLAGLLGGDQ